MKDQNMGYFSCFSSQQTRYKRVLNKFDQEFSSPSESRQSVSAAQSHPFSNLQRDSATNLLALVPAASIMRVASTDFLEFENDLSAWKNSGPPSQREHRQRVAKHLRSAKRLREPSLTLRHIELDDLPECLNRMSSLTELDLYECRIGKLVALPPNLQILRAIGTGLTQLPPLPATLQRLVTNHNLLETVPQLPDQLSQLHLSHNQLRRLPDLPASLYALHVSHNLLEALPEIPANTYHIEANHNRLTDLPVSITETKKIGRITVEDNPIPTSVLDRIELAIARRSDDAVMYRDPVKNAYRRSAGIFESSTQLGHGPVTSQLVEAVLSWHDELPDSTIPSNTFRETWEITDCKSINMEGMLPWINFAVFLERIRETAEYKDSRLRPELAGRICRLLDRLPGNDALRRQCFALATNTVGECQDQVAVCLEEMERCALCSDASDGTLDQAQIYALGIKMLKMEELKAVCTKFIERYPSTDAVELHLALSRQLGNAVDLPSAPPKIHYDDSVEISSPQWSEILERVNTAGSDRERQIALLAKWGPWQASLERQAFPALSAACDERFRNEQRLQAELESAMDELAKIPPAAGEFSDAYFELHAQISRINLAFNDLERQIVDPVRLQLTRALLTPEQDEQRTL